MSDLDALPGPICLARRTLPTQSCIPFRVNRSMLRFALVLAAAAVIATPSIASNRCRDAHGKFIKRPPPKAAPAKTCRGANGKFVKCGTPEAKPA